ncbi:chorismate synthase [Candidatus Protochlamydia phocaeensis]|uniref:chorismate synthase n=1 Tax=Candidatus Protochlamydia phocaeensis TaxID=1414722 RepID=UPI0008386FF0|nr:chorismate synthase [Candidatus Protochlamydia phocaeensis]
MSANSFGNIFKITTWGESHGKAIGVVIDGCPAGIEISEAEINQALALRAPGKNPHTSPRKESDQGEILSGVFEGRTTGAPICICIRNHDADSSKYESIKELLRPGHANFTYLEKYGLFDYRGGGRSSARETAARVAAGAVASKFLKYFGIELYAYIKQIHSVKANIDYEERHGFHCRIYENPLFCPDAEAAKTMVDLIEKAKAEGDSLGGVVEFLAIGLPTGLGDPVYQKLEANLAYAMMSLPATKGFEMGSGFKSAGMKGSEHNDLFIEVEGKIQTKTNHAGGTLGGISTGMPLIGRVAFKPTSSIAMKQETLTASGKPANFTLPIGSRHDPCVAIRAVPVVSAMLALVLADAVLLNRCVRL